MNHHPISNADTSVNLSERKRKRAQKRKVTRIMTNILLSFVIFVVAFIGASYAIGFWTPWGKEARITLAETIISTRHGYLAHYLTTSGEYAALMKQLNPPVVSTGVPSDVKVVDQPVQQQEQQQSTSVIETNPITGNGYNGYVMLVHDPKLVRLVPAVVHNKMGEYITDIAKRTGAVAGVNASGFEDPNGGGWGGEAVGLVYVNGRAVQTGKTDSWVTVGFTKSGIMVMGQYTVSELQSMGVRDAMQFHPQLVVNGRPMITSGDGGWGYGPRTAIGQAKDGTVIFIVINGRFKGGSGMGASQRQVMDLMLKYGAVNACAMDGGSSSVLYRDGTILNTPSTIDPNGQRHLPDAWMVFPTEAAAIQGHN